MRLFAPPLVPLEVSKRDTPSALDYRVPWHGLRKPILVQHQIHQNYKSYTRQIMFWLRKNLVVGKKTNKLRGFELDWCFALCNSWSSITVQQLTALCMKAFHSRKAEHLYSLNHHTKIHKVLEYSIYTSTMSKISIAFFFVQSTSHLLFNYKWCDILCFHN